MVDTLKSRVARILAGSAHALLDAVEDLAPEAMLRQATREIDQVIGEVRTDLGRIEAAKHLITTQINKLNTENEQLAGQIELAMSTGNEALARAGISRQLLIEDQTPVLQSSLADQRESAGELEGYITALLAKRREMEDTLHEFLAAQSKSAPALNASARREKSARVDNAQNAFDRVIARQTGVRGLIGAPGDAQKLKELQDLQRSNRIEERLASLKFKATP